MPIKCLEKRYRETVELNPDDTKYGFAPDQISLSSKLSRYMWSMSKTSTHVLSTVTMHATWSLEKSFGKCCGSSVLTAPVIGRQAITFLLRICVHVKSQPFSVGGW